MYAAEDRGNTYAVRSQRERWAELSHAFSTYPQRFPSDRIPWRFPARFPVDSTHRRRRTEGLEMMSGRD